MINLLVPLSGLGKRFVDAGYTVPKSLIIVGDKTNIEWSMSCINWAAIDIEVYFIIRKDQQLNFDLGTILKNKFPLCHVIEIPKETQGAVETCLYAEDVITSDPLAIYCPDVFFEPKLCLEPELFQDCDGRILTFKANSTNYSYVELDKNGFAQRTAEKKVISPFAAVGAYLFSNGQDFVRAGKTMMTKELKTNNEYFICPLYNLLIEEGKRIAVTNIEKMHVFGTPEEFNFFTQCSMRTFADYKTNVALCADHSGALMKDLAKGILSRLGIPYIDFGTFSAKDCDYTGFVKEATRSIIDHTCSFGMGFCKTGQGINISANKTPGIRAALVHDEYMSEYAIRHNCANFFSIPSKYVNSVELLEKIIINWKTHTFDGGRHQNRLQGLQ